MSTPAERLAYRDIARLEDHVDELMKENTELKALVIECVDTFKDMSPEWAAKIMAKLNKEPVVRFLVNEDHKEE